MVVVAGLVNLNNSNAHGRIQIRKVKQLVEYIDEDKQSYFRPKVDKRKDDIALLEVDRPFVFNSFVQPICIPRPHETFINKVCIASGWGEMNSSSKSISSLFISI